MRSVVFLPILLVVLILQLSVINQVQILSGFADIVLLLVVIWAIHTKGYSYLVWAAVAGAFFAFSSAGQPFVPVISYVLAALLARWLANITWQAPVMTLVIATLAGSLLENGIGALTLWVQSDFTVNLLTVAQQILLPASFLNLLFLIPLNALVADIASWCSPEQETL